MFIPTYIIAIPVYERMLGFKEALNAALAVEGCTQVLVVDDNSSHDDFKVACDAINNGKIKYEKNIENVGLFANWNKCIAIADSDFISILCSDDFIESNAYMLFLEAYKVQNNIDVFFGSFATFTTTIKKHFVHRTYKDGPVKGVDLLADTINNGPAFPVLSIMRRATMLKYPFVSKPHSGNDWLWIYTNASALNLYATSKIINYWRLHAEQDAVVSKSVTMDCWPLMYQQMALQLNGIDNGLAVKATRKAKGLLLFWLLDGYVTDKGWQKKITLKDEHPNIFIASMRQIIKEDWLLSKLLTNKNPNYLLYITGKIMIKTPFYLL